MITIQASYDFAIQEATFDILGAITVIPNSNDNPELWGQFSQTGDTFDLYVYLNDDRDRAEFYIYGTEKIQGQDITLWNHMLFIGTAGVGQTAECIFDYNFTTFQGSVTINGNTQLIDNPNGNEQFKIAALTERGREPVDTEIEFRLNASKSNCEIFLFPLVLGIRDQKGEFRVGEFDA